MNMNIRLCIITICTLINSNSFAQTKPEGIGKLKIGKTTIAIIDQLKDEFDLKHYNVINPTGENTFDQKAFANESAYAELLPDTNDSKQSPLHAHICPFTRTFEFANYTVAGINLRRLYLVFYKDTLQSIQCDGMRELEQAMTLKYGPAKSDVAEKEVNCNYSSSGAVTVSKEISNAKHWGEGDIIGTSYLHKYYTDQCTEILIYTFTIENIRFMSYLNDCDSDERLGRVRKEAELKAKELGDF